MIRGRPGHRLRAAGAVVAPVVLAVLVAGCGTDSRRSSDTGSSTLTVYSSAPLRGSDAAQARGVVNGEKLALEQAGGRAGPFTVKYLSLDEADPATGSWDPGAVAENARRAVMDNSTIAYLGELGNGATAVSLPILNEAGIPQVSPLETYAGLTRPGGAGEPDKYYPSGRRSFVRLVADDQRQAAAQARLQHGDGCRSTLVLSDRSPYGQAMAGLVARALPAAGVTVADTFDFDLPSSQPVTLAASAKDAGADCVFLAAVNPADSAAVLRGIHSADPSLGLYAPGALAVARFAADLGPAGPAVRITGPIVRGGGDPALRRRFAAAYRRAFGQAPPPGAANGYEAMNAVLAAIRAAGDKGNDREAVRRALLTLRDRPSVLGTYSVQPGGDVAPTAVALYRVRGGRLVPAGTVPAGG